MKGFSLIAIKKTLVWSNTHMVEGTPSPLNFAPITSHRMCSCVRLQLIWFCFQVLESIHSSFFFASGSWKLSLIRKYDSFIPQVPEDTHSTCFAFAYCDIIVNHKTMNELDSRSSRDLKTVLFLLLPQRRFRFDVVLKHFVSYVIRLCRGWLVLFAAAKQVSFILYLSGVLVLFAKHV